MRIPLPNNARTKLAVKNVVLSILLKGVSILISFIMVPITIRYVDSTQYGIWLTVSSLMAWFYFFDIGFTNGFRNRFAESIAKNDILRAKEYVSTTYAALIVLASLMLLIVLPINELIDWSNVLNISNEYRNILKTTFLILISFLALNLICQVFTTMVIADQRPAITSIIQVVGQALSLLGIYVAINLSTEGGSITTLAFIYSGIPFLVTFFSSIIFFTGRYKRYSPSLSSVRIKLIPNILGIGMKFFIITTSMLFIFQLMNVIISRELGPDSVTEYNIAYKYYNIIFMVAVLILTPFWSAFTDAYTKQDYSWMRNVSNKLQIVGLLAIPVLLLMVLISNWFFSVWIGDGFSVPLKTNLSVSFYVFLLVYSNIYMYLMNGLGKVTIQLYVYLLFALIAFPAMSLMCRTLGLTGLLIIPSFVYLFQIVLGRIQLGKILNQKATGIWNR